MSKNCAFTGHRTIKEDFDCILLEKTASYLIERQQVSTFYCGMARGFDLIAGQLILKLKTKYKNLKLIACIPCKGQEFAFSLEEKNKYYEILDGCNEVIVLSEKYYNGCMQARDRFMVDNSDCVIAYLNENSGGTFYTVNYAKSLGKEIYII